jgi:phospholipase C
MADIEHLVVIMMENHSFDEYFGTFPGANGFFGPSPAFKQPWHSQVQLPNGLTSPPSPLLPWRMSTFTSGASLAASLAHQWDTMHVAVNPQPGSSYPDGANNMGFYIAQGWGQPKAQSGAVMGYYVADDIPYHWALASNFALCDNYFCSALSGTGPNRMYLMGGTILPSDPSSAPGGPPVGNVYPMNPNPSGSDLQPPVRNNAPGGGQGAPVGSSDPDPDVHFPTMPGNQYDCPNYLAALQVTPTHGNPFLYRIYDDWNWAWDGAESQPVANGGSYGDLNYFDYYKPVSGVQLGCYPDPNYYAANDSDNASLVAGDPRPLFAQHILPQDGSQPTIPLARVTWIWPPWNYSEHPDCNSNTMAADGGRYLSQIVDALIASQYWETTVLVIVYDETNTHFDHVVPPLAPTPDDEPWINEVNDPPNNQGLGYAAPIGAGMRVPAIIVSPWTYGAGVIHETMDHTSLLQLAETLTQIPCEALPPKAASNGWRRKTFSNLADVINGLGNQSPASAETINAGRSSPTGLPTAGIAERWWNNAQARYNNNSNPPQAPLHQTWPPVAQSCELIMPVGSYDLLEVKNIAVTSGGETTATFPGALRVRIFGFEPNELTNPDALGPRDDNVSTPSGTRTARAPTVTFSNPNISAQPSTPFIDADPTDPPPPVVSGIPVMYTFTYDLVFSNFDDIFPAPPAIPGAPTLTNRYSVTATFQVDAAFMATAELELVSTQDPQFYKNFTDDTTWLSGELVAFSLAAGESMFGVRLGEGGSNAVYATAADALKFITEVISRLNHPAEYPDLEEVFHSLDAPEDAHPLSMVLPQPNEPPTFNFALARVHMNSTTSAKNVRVFFRSCRASVTTSAYDAQGPTTGPSYEPAFYRSNPATGESATHTKIPLMGVGQVAGMNGNASLEYVTIPFFATPRVDPNTASMAGQGADAPNVVKTFPAASGDKPATRYYGCWLDINESQPEHFLPTNVPHDGHEWDGPWNTATTFPPGTQFLSINAAFNRDLHQCLVAEISFEGITIPPGDTPGYSSWLAQRNLAFVTS